MKHRNHICMAIDRQLVERLRNAGAALRRDTAEMLNVAVLEYLTRCEKDHGGRFAQRERPDLKATKPANLPVCLPVPQAVHQPPPDVAAFIVRASPTRKSAAGLPASASS